MSKRSPKSGGSLNPLCPRPDCGGRVAPSDRTVLDRRERPWHADCAARALADYFRSPVDVEALEDPAVTFDLPDATTRVERYADGRVSLIWPAPHDFDVTALVFPVDTELGFLFIGNINAFPVAPSPLVSIVSGDFPEGRVPLSSFVPRAMDLTLQLRSREPFQQQPACRIEGVRRVARAPRVTYTSPLVAMLVDVTLDERGEGHGTVTLHAPFRPERVACDDWRGVRILRLEVGDERGGRNGPPREELPLELELGGRVTPLPAFIARPMEPVRVFVRAPGRSSVRLRLYGASATG